MHKVICPYCKQSFDRDKIPYVKVNSKRYAHIECAEAEEHKKTKEERDKETLEKYMEQLFGDTISKTKIKKQLNAYLKEGYDYVGILRALSYFYEVKGNDIAKANGGIGIVPYVYQQAHDYYYSIWLAKQKNINKNIEDYKVKAREVHIEPPKRKPRRPKIFTFLDEDDI